MLQSHLAELGAGLNGWGGRQQKIRGEAVMKYMLKLVFTFLLLSMSAAYAQSANEPKAMPFHISCAGQPMECRESLKELTESMNPQ